MQTHAETSPALETREGGQADLILTEDHRAQPILGEANLSWVVGGSPRAGLLFWIHDLFLALTMARLTKSQKKKVQNLHRNKLGSAAPSKGLSSISKYTAVVLCATFPL